MSRLPVIAKSWPILGIAAGMALIASGRLTDGPRQLPLKYMVGCFTDGASRAIIGADQRLLVDGKLFQMSKLLEENGHYWIETTPGFDIEDGRVVPSAAKPVMSRIEVFHHGAPGAAIRFWGEKSTAEMPWLRKRCSKN